MSPAVLAGASAVVILATSAVLAAYLYVIGTRVRHIAETLNDKIAAGAEEMIDHASGIGPTSAGLRRHLAALQSSFT